jgi:hypothetical protein
MTLLALGPAEPRHFMLLSFDQLFLQHVEDPGKEECIFTKRSQIILQIRALFENGMLRHRIFRHAGGQIVDWETRLASGNSRKCKNKPTANIVSSGPEARRRTSAGTAPNIENAKTNPLAKPTPRRQSHKRRQTHEQRRGFPQRERHSQHPHPACTIVIRSKNDNPANRPLPRKRCGRGRDAKERKNKPIKGTTSPAF